MSNRTKSHQSSTGVARSGTALLAGLMRCARCGHKLNVAYRGGKGKAPRYLCMTGNREQGAPSCLSFAAWRVERAIVEVVLEACQPLGVEASLQVLEKCHEEQDQKRKALELALEKARYEAGRARRQYDSADPENRLVAAELENRWNTALVQVAGLESRLAAEDLTALPLTESQREQLTTLGEDLQALWNEATTPLELKKRVLRTVINEVVVDVKHDSGHVEMKIHWAGGVHTPLRVRKNKIGTNGNATDSDIVDMVRELAKDWNDGYMRRNVEPIRQADRQGQQLERNPRQEPQEGERHSRVLQGRPPHVEDHVGGRQPAECRHGGNQNDDQKRNTPCKTGSERRSVDDWRLGFGTSCCPELCTAVRNR